MELLSFYRFISSGTILPAQSEAVLAGLHLAGGNSAVLLVIVATTGNVLGSCVNWLLGRYLVHFLSLNIKMRLLISRLLKAF